MKIYTKTGDDGTTCLYSGERVPKECDRVEAYGTIDELGAALGLARALCRNRKVAEGILAIQRFLPKLMADIASINGQANFDEDIRLVEETIDSLAADLSPFSGFATPGDNPGEAALHVARTVARRAERRLWSLSRQQEVGGEPLVLLNRLSDLCFVLARYESEI